MRRILAQYFPLCTAFMAISPLSAAGRRWALICLLGLLTACSQIGGSDILDEKWPPAEKLPDLVSFTQAGLYPEGVQSIGQAGFLVSSQTTGSIGMVSDNGTYSVFADSPDLISTVGLHISENRNQVLAAVSDPGYNLQRTTPATKGKMARLAIFSFSNPQLAPRILDLGAQRPNAPGHFANDIALDNQGNAYITDSFAPIIYKVTPDYEVTVFAESPLFSAPTGTFGLNGIVVHPDGYLLVAKTDEGIIFKVPLNNPTAITPVATSQNLQGADGLLLYGGMLQVVTNTQAKVYSLASPDNWASATVSGTFSTPPQYPTTLTFREGLYGGERGSFVLYSNLNALQANTNPPVSQYTIARVKF